jgi:hypothetical protein
MSQTQYPRVEFQVKPVMQPQLLPEMPEMILLSAPIIALQLIH